MLAEDPGSCVRLRGSRNRLGLRIGLGDPDPAGSEAPPRPAAAACGRHSSESTASGASRFGRGVFSPSAAAAREVVCHGGGQVCVGLESEAWMDLSERPDSPGPEEDT